VIYVTERTVLKSGTVLKRGTVLKLLAGRMTVIEIAPVGQMNFLRSDIAEH
jgi:hypothetical protein